MNYHRSDYDDLGGLSDDQVNRYFTSGWIAFTYALGIAIILGALAFAWTDAEAQTACPWDAACITITPPTTYTDGTPLAATSIASYLIESSPTSSGPWTTVVTIPGSQTTYQRRPVTGSLWYRASVILVSGAFGVASSVKNDVTVEPSASAPLITVAGTGYRMDLGNYNQIKIAGIGLVALGVACKADNAMGLNVIDRNAVRLDPGKTRPKQVLAKCG